MRGEKKVKVRRIKPDPRLRRYYWLGEGGSWQMCQDWTLTSTRETPEEVYARGMRRIERFGRDEEAPTGQ